MKKRIIDKTDPTFNKCPVTLEGEVFICHTYADDGTFTGTVSAPQETIDEVINDLTENEREFLGWNNVDCKETIDDIKREGIVLCKCTDPDKKVFKDKTELHAAMRAKGIEP